MYKVSLTEVAFKNLGRHKVKSIITIIGIAVTVWLYIITDAFSLGRMHNIEISTLNYETGAAKIQTKEYFKNREDIPLYENFNNYQNILDKLDNTGYDSAPRVKFKGSLLSSDKEVPLIFIGVDPEYENRVFKYNKYIKEGNFVKNDEFSVLIGNITAKELKVNAGDAVRLSTVIDKKDENNVIKHINQVIDLKIAGIFTSPDPYLNSNFGIMPLSILQGEQGMMLEGNITEICIRKKNVSEQDITHRTERVSIIEKNIESYKVNYLTTNKLSR